MATPEKIGPGGLTSYIRRTLSIGLLPRRGRMLLSQSPSELQLPDSTDRRKQAGEKQFPKTIGGGMKGLRLAFVVPAVFALLVPLFSACAYAQGETLRLGFLTVRTGPLAAGGKQIEDGINLLLKERNNTFAGP